MKIQFTLPGNDSFFNRYATLTPTVYKIGFLAQIISGLTEIGVIYSLIYSRVFEIAPSMAVIIAFIGALVGTAFLEVGLRKFIPYSVKAFLFKRFKGLDLAMSVFIILVAIGLLFCSGGLSFKGSKELVEIAKPTIELKNTEVINSKFAQDKKDVFYNYKSDSIAIAGNLNGEIKAQEKYYLSLIEVEKSNLEKYQAKELRIGKSYRTTKERIIQKIEKLEAKRDQILANLEKSKSGDLLKLLQDKKTEVAMIRDTMAVQASRIEQANNSAILKADSKTGKYGNMLAWFTVVCLIVFVFSVIINEINKKGSGINQVAQPNQYQFSESISSEFINMIGDKYNYHLRTKIRKLADKTPAPPLPMAPPVLYDLSNATQARLKVGIEEPQLKELKLAYPLPTGSTPNANTILDQDINTKALEDTILQYVKASIELAKSNLVSQSKEMELKAIDVIKCYLGADANKKNIEQLKGQIIG